jgi:hypothetical protein
MASRPASAQLVMTILLVFGKGRTIAALPELVARARASVHDLSQKNLRGRRAETGYGS